MLVSTSSFAVAIPLEILETISVVWPHVETDCF